MDKKSPGIAALLGFLFGGFGLMYVSVAQGFVALGILLVVALITGGAGTPVVWLGCGIWGWVAASNYNEKQAAFDVQNAEVRAFDATVAATPAQPAQTAGSYCPACGAPARSGARFCTSCGGGL